jgi:hypothetical protein
MVRRWSYLASDKIEYVVIKAKLKPVLFKKGFKYTVRFRKNFSSISKVSKKRYSFRKIKNSNFPLIINSFAWAKSYLNLTFIEKKIQFKEMLLPNSSMSQNNFKAHMLSGFVHNNVKFLNLKLKKKSASSIRILSNFIFFSSVINYNNLININWIAELSTRSFNFLLSVKKLMILCVLLRLHQKLWCYIKTNY